MNNIQAFSILGIPVARDVKAVKKAYQRQIVFHHPEEDPEGFMVLHQAYKTALAYAQNKRDSSVTSVQLRWNTEQPPHRRELTGFDSLFEKLSEEQKAATPEQKQAFFQKLQLLNIRWLPIRLRRWKQFFRSEAYLICRTEPECMEHLLALISQEKHSYSVYMYLVERLWELEGWQQGEAREDLAGRTRMCIVKLQEKYCHYQKLIQLWRVLQYPFIGLWYYQLMPFYFKLMVSSLLLPVLSFGSESALGTLIMLYYALELTIVMLRGHRWCNFIFPNVRTPSATERLNSALANEFLFIIGMFALAMHAGACFVLIEKIYGAS